MQRNGSEISSPQGISPPETLTSDRSERSGPASSEGTPRLISSPALASGLPLSAKQDGPTTDLFGLEVAPASLSAQPVSDWVQQTKDTCGPSGLALSKSYDLSLSLANRLRARTDLLGSTLFNLTWTERHTPAGRLIFALRASVRRTSASACSSWPTPMAGTPAQKGYNAAGNTDSSRKTVALCSWPTPTAAGNIGDLQKKAERRARAKEKHKGRTGNGFGLSLSEASQLASWATPTARDMRSEHGTPEMMQRRQDRQAGKPLSKQVLLTDSGAEPSGFHAQTENRGRLRAGHSRWLMSIPAGWDDCAPTGTRSSKKRQPNSSPQA